jgi:hypothetical protein
MRPMETTMLQHRNRLQVVDVHARPILAGVVDLLPFGNLAMLVCVEQAVDEATAEDGIAITVAIAVPQDAILNSKRSQAGTPSSRAS